MPPGASLDGSQRPRHDRQSAKPPHRVRTEVRTEVHDRMTTLTTSQKWRNRALHDAGSRAVQTRGLVFTITLAFGALLATRVHLILPFWTCWVWLLLPWWARGQMFARLHVAVALGLGATMLGVWLWQTDLAPPLYVPHHPAFGEHPVTVLAGFPWQGVEGVRPMPLAQDRIPFDMGVDALFVNMTAFTALFHWLLRRCQPSSARGLLVFAAGFATVCTLGGVWQLITMFD